jgi:translation initiation factor IF-3
MIRVPEVRLIGPEGEQYGILGTSAALDRAQDMGYDLVEISPNAQPPVCKIMDYGKFRFEEEKRMKDSRKKQKIIRVKEIKFRPITDDHDFEYKVRNGIKFLERGDKLKITIRFRGREMTHQELGQRVLEKVRELITQSIQVIEEKKPLFEGRNLIMILSPAKRTPTRAANASGQADDDEDELDSVDDADEDLDDDDDDDGDDSGGNAAP